jgi:DNA-binding response OmpR family regulator
MSLRNVALLHVEDDPMQQRIIAHHLKAIPEYAFAITAVASEELAMACFQKTKIDLVLLDYQLVQGNGMHLLGRLRELDPITPIIAISGVATSEIAAELVLAGADDYFNKGDLKSGGLGTSIRSSLRRADAVRKTIASRSSDELNRLAPQMASLCAEYARRIGVDFLGRLDVVAQEMKRTAISVDELKRIHDNAASQIEAAVGVDQNRMKLLARPLLLELLVRVFDAA